MLTEQMRAATDPCFRQFLTNVRHRKVTQNDLNYLNQRLLSFDTISPDLLNTIEWSNAPIITPLNSTVFLLNQFKVTQFAKKNRLPLFVSLAFDTINGEKIRDLNLLKEIKQKFTIINSSATSNNKKLQTARVLHFTFGSKILLTDNIATEFGLVNGAIGTIVNVIFPDEQHVHRSQDRSLIQLDRPPKCILFTPDIPHPNLAKIQFPSLPENVIPLFPKKEIMDVKHPNGRYFKVQRTQFPFTGAYAFTDYKTQGKTFERLIIDPLSIKSSYSPYVMLSRATCLNSIILLRPFTLSQLNKPWPTNFLKRLSEILEKEI
jgi:hypothetical protein